MICAIYPRKSKRKEDSESMQMQVDMCKEYINRKFQNAKIVVYGNDYGVTGHSVKKREDFKRMMNDVKNHKIDAVVIYKYDRISRNMYDFVTLFHDLEEVGCALVSVTQDIDTSTPSGRLMMYQLAAFAEHEWQMTSQRYRDTFAYMDKAGINHLPQQCLPLGYMPDKETKKVVKNPETAEIVEFIISDYLRYGTIYHAKKSTHEKYGIDCSVQIVKTILFGDLCRGIYKGNENFCEPYINKENAEKIDRLRQKYIRYDSPNEYDYLFKGLIKCPVCGHKFTGKRSKAGKAQKQYTYYRCRQYYDTFKCSHRSGISEISLEKWMLENIEQYFDNYTLEITQSHASVKKQNPEKLQKEMNRLNEVYIKGRLSEEEYEKRFAAIQTKLDYITAQGIVSEQRILSKDEFLFDGWRNTYHALSNANKHLFWSGFVNQILVDEAGKPYKIIFL